MRGIIMKINDLINYFIIGLFFGMGFELASWLIDYIMQKFGFALG
jgi:hypothetical protein